MMIINSISYRIPVVSAADTATLVGPVEDIFATGLVAE
jgi:hypothetical protein